MAAHGTRRSYKDGCRCTECAAAESAYRRAQRERRQAKTPPTHGTDNTYRNWGCRCTECKAAHAKTLRAYRHSRKEVPA